MFIFPYISYLLKEWISTNLKHTLLCLHPQHTCRNFVTDKDVERSLLIKPHINFYLFESWAFLAVLCLEQFLFILFSSTAVVRMSGASFSGTGYISQKMGNFSIVDDFRVKVVFRTFKSNGTLLAVQDQYQV